MKSSKSTYRYEFNNGFCAGNMTHYFCEQQGLPTSGSEHGIGWGATPKKAKESAKRNKKVSGNVDIEWVVSHCRLWKNGNLVSETF